MSASECFYLISADTALRVALVEQLTVAPFAEVILHEMEDLPPAFSPKPDVVILDAESTDKKTLIALCNLCGQEKKPKIFLLGEPESPVSVDESTSVTESFSKPLRLGHFLARLQFHTQPVRMQTRPLTFGAFRLEPTLRQVVASDGEVIRLTEKETHLLEYLGRTRQPVTREELLAAIWGYDARIDTHTLETHIYRLRRKLDSEGRGIEVIIASPGAYGLAAAPEQ